MQFSIRQLMGWTAVAAVSCAVLFAFPSWAGLAVVGLVLLWLPILLVCGVIYARGWRRTFFIGALIAGAPFLVPLLFYLPVLLISGGLGGLDLSELAQPGGLSGLAFAKFAIAAFLAYVASNGLAAVATRWLISPRDSTSGSTPATVTAPSYAVVRGRLVTEVLPQPDAISLQK
jgi:hypothetical protein